MLGTFDGDVEDVGLGPGDAVALDDLRDADDEFGKAREAVAGDADLDEGGHGEADLFRADLGVVAHDDASLFEFVDALGGRRRGESETASELGKGDAGVALQFVEDAEVDGVQPVYFQPIALSKSLGATLGILAFLQTEGRLMYRGLNCG